MSASPLRRQQRADLVKLTIFLTVSTLIAVWLGMVMGETRPGDKVGYRAEFEDISGLANGDDVRVAGVTVGTVTGIDVKDDATVLVDFSVPPDLELDTASTATIQYRNLIGDRVLELEQPDDAAEVLEPGGTLPTSQTYGALDLDTLLNGFKPLFAGLNANQINELSSELVAVLQGQSGAVESLVSSVGSFTTRIAEREQLITAVIGNLNTVLGTIDARGDSVGRLIDELDSLVVGLDRQDTRILDAAGQIDGMAVDTSRLLRNARGDINADLRGLELTARGLNSRADTLTALLGQLPKHYRAISDTASYGNFFNFFLCGVRLTMSDPDGSPTQTPWILSEAERCDR